jgi:hypothetical protein
MTTTAKVPAAHPTAWLEGRNFKPPRCGNCAPKNGRLEESPEMLKADDRDGYICGKCGRVILWYRLSDGGLTLDIPQ